MVKRKNKDFNRAYYLMGKVTVGAALQYHR